MGFYGLLSIPEGPVTGQITVSRDQDTVYDCLGTGTVNLRHVAYDEVNVLVLSSTVITENYQLLKITILLVYTFLEARNHFY